ncbi:MAG: hypothetical protein ACLGHQ_06980 [Acidimicrobiia bacterium]
MKIRASASVLARVVVVTLLATFSVSAPAAAALAASTPVGPSAVVASSTPDDDDTTRPTFNEFLPEQRPLGDCLGALQRPNCGSEARGGWGQTAVFVAILGGLAFIAWRVVATSRRARRRTAGSGDVTPGTPGATSAPDGAGGDPTP